jgi:hypothetical protein
LQYSRQLSFFQRVQENDLAAREFQRVAVTYRVLSVDLSKDCCPVFDDALSGWQGGPMPDVVSEGQLGPRKYAHRDVFVFRGTKSPCARIEHAGR